MLNRAQLKKDQDASKRPKKSPNPYKDDVLYSPMGQWQFPGQVTKVPSGNITMQGVPYPVNGIDNFGNSQMMYPGGDYQFPGDYVTEYPQMVYGGTPKIGQIWDRLGRLHSIKSYVPFAKNGGSNTNNMSKSFKGRKGPFPQIQTEAEFFSPYYANIESPYDHGSFANGGGFGEGHPFSTQPTMKEISSYGRPNWPYFFAQYGGSDTTIHDDTMSAMGQYPIAPANYRFPTVPGVYGEYYGGYDPNPWPPRYSKPQDAPPTSFMYEEDPDLVLQQQRMGGSKKKPCYNCGGAYKKHLGGSHATSAEFNQGQEFFANKLNKFTGALRDTATQATIDQMAKQLPGYHTMPDGSLMSDSEMGYRNGGGTGYNEMFPYAMPYQYAGGGENWIQGAVNPAHKGYCTPMTKKTCTPRRKAFAMTMKKHHGFHKKQEGGQMQEEKWQAIIGLVQQGVTDPQAIAAQLNTEGTYPTTPEEVQGYLEQEMGGGEDAGYEEDSFMKMGGYYYPGGGAVPNVTGLAPVPGTNSEILYAPGATPETNWLTDPNWSGAMISPRDRVAPAPTTTTPGFQYQYQDPAIQQRMATQRGYADTSAWINSPTVKPGDLATVNKIKAWNSRQLGGDTNPNAMDAIDMYSGAYGEASQNADVFGGLTNFLGATANLQNGGKTPAFSPEQLAALDEYFRSKGQPVNYPTAPGRSYNGYGYFPANSSPYIKIKNKNFYNGVPQRGQNQPAMLPPGGPQGTFQTPGGYGKISSNYGRGFLGLGPTRLKSIDYEWGNGSGLPADSQAYINQNPLNRNGKRTTWAGNKLRGLTKNADKYGTPFPSKRRKEDYEFDERYKANQANQASNAYAQSLNPQVPAQVAYGPENAPVGNYPTPLLPPGQQPVQVNPESWRQTGIIDKNLSTAEFTKQTDAYLAELEKRHPSPTRKWFLGKKTYPEGSKKWGGHYQGGGSTEDLAFNPMDYFNPDGDEENLPGYTPGPTLNDQQTGQIFGEQQNSMNEDNSMSSKGRIKFGNRMQGEDAANWGIAGLELGANIFSQDEKRNAENQLKKRFKAENIFSSRQDRDRGDYTTNYGYFRPDQQSVGNMVTGKFGGSYQEGGEYELSEEEIQRLRDGGYQIEFI